MNDFEKACAEVDHYSGDAMQENVIEWVNSDTATVNFVAYNRFAGRVRKLAEERDEVEIISDKDGVLLAHIPVDWIRINPSIKLTEEQRAKKAEILNRNREKSRENQF